MVKAVRKSPIQFFSDLFIVAMVSLWIFDSLYETIIASAVTLSSIALSFRVGESCIDTTMWAGIGTNIAMPLSVGGAVWMIKNGIQHAIFNANGQECPADFDEVIANEADSSG